MPNRDLRKAVRFLKDADDLVKVVTGKRIPRLVSDGLELLGYSRDKQSQDEHVDFASPYFVLGVRPDAADLVVKAAYRSLCREYHPDTGTKPDSITFQKVVEAYNKVMAERHPPAAA